MCDRCRADVDDRQLYGLGMNGDVYKLCRRCYDHVRGRRLKAPGRTYTGP